MKKGVFALILALMIATTSIVAISSVYANETEPTTAIEGHNLSLQDNVYIMYYVTFDGIPSGAETGVLIWTSQQETYAYGTEKAKALYDGVSDGYSVYYFTGVSAKMMSQDIYAVSYIKDGDNITYSKLDKYSVLQYAYNKKDSTTIMGEGGTTLGELVAGLLDYGTLAQTYFRYNLDRLANTEYYQVKVKNGTLADGTKSGLYQTGDKVMLSAAAEKDGIPFSCWKDEAGAIVGNETNIQVTAGSKDKTYTATYIKTSAGLEFESNEDGTCALIGMGDCTDTDVIIPSRSPDGDLVTSIDNSAFSGEAITSITIPVGIEEIGRNAFKGCNDLTDVYYEGTTAQWEEIDIKSGNTPLTDATLHANDVFYTVTFVDYDGTQLKTKQVIEGGSATAPADPEREGYTFTGWDKSFANVTGDLTITATYELTVSDPTIIVDSVNANAGDTVTVNVKIKNNPGIAGAILTIAYDSNLSLMSATSGETFSSLQFTGPGKYSNPCNFTWDSESGMVTEDGIILTLQFGVSDAANAGDKLNINCSYRNGDIYDESLNDITLNIVNGQISIQ